MSNLTDCQLVAIEKLSRLRCGALFMEMGTGKTRTALELMRSKKNKCDFFAWFCPVSLKSEIETERLKWAPDIDLNIFGIESMSSSDRLYLDALNEIKSHSSFVVVDESLKIKNISAKRTRRLLSIGRVAKYRLILNGTPISNNIVDLWSQMQFLSPLILNMNKRDFDRNFIEYRLIRSGSRMAVKKPIGQANLDALMAMIEPYVFDSKLNNNIKREYKTIYYQVDSSEYATAKSLIMDDYRFSNNLISWFAVIARCQQWYCQNGTRGRILSKFLESLDEQCIVFVKYVESIPPGAQKLTGETPLSDRVAIIDNFLKGNINVLWMTYGVGAFGLNLQSCHHMVFLEHTWDYAQRIQAEARIARMGQKETCQFYDFVCENTGLESNIMDALKRKSVFKAEVSQSLDDM